MELAIKNGKTKLVYKFSRLTVEQVELAREIGEWKLQQIESPPDDFNMIVRSKGAGYLAMLCSYLMTPKNGKEIEKFKIENCAEIEQIIKTSPASELSKLKEITKDFFLNIGDAETGLILLQPKRERQESEALLRTLLAISETTTNLSRGNNQSSPDLMKEKSTEGLKI